MAITSAVVEAPKSTVDKLAYVIVRCETGFPTIPIGVEPYIDDLEQIDQLKEAGADEIKLNIETYDRELFHKVCGELDLDWIMDGD